MSIQNKPKKSPKEAVFNVLRQISYTKLFKKYSSGDFSFNKISINNLIFNENCLVVARFKDFLIYDDNTEFFRRFYSSKDSILRLNRILTFYEKYSKIFPNYLVLKESKYLYKNIRKKQKMIDAFNQIKREENENRKKLKNNGKEKGNNDLNELFTKKIKNEIKAYQNNISIKNYKNSFDSDKNNDDTLLINQNSISIYYKQLKEEENEDKKLDSFITNQTNGSISSIVNILNDNKIYTKDLPNLLAQNNFIIFNKSKKKLKNGIEIKSNKIENIPRKKEKEILTIQNTIKTLNDISNIDENENLSTKNIKNNSQIENKKIAGKNTLYKNVITSSNATNSSSIMSKKIKNRQNSSSLNKKTKEKKQNKNINNDIQNNKAIRDNINFNKSNNNIAISKENKLNNNNNNFNNNLYQKTSPNYEIGLKKNFYKTNNNFKKISSNKRAKNSKENKHKNSIDKKANKKAKKDNYKISNEIVKNYTKKKNTSQDFDSNLIYRMTKNILINKNKIDSNKDSNNKNNTENNQHNIFLINDNPNLITGDTKANERNEENSLEDKIVVSARDMIKQERENENQIKSKSKKLFHSPQKIKISKENSLKLTKTIRNVEESAKSLKNYKVNRRYLNAIESNKLNLKKNIDENENEINNNIRKNSAFTKQKTEIKMINNKQMMKGQKTKSLFTKDKNKSKSSNKKLLIKSSENFNKTKNIFKKSNKNKENKEKNNIVKIKGENKEKVSKVNTFKEKNIKIKEKNNIIKEKDITVKERNKEINANNNTKLFSIKYESALFSPTKYSTNNKTERKMTTYLSNAKMKKNSENFSPNMKEQKQFRSKIKISKNKKIQLNKSAKCSNEETERKYKSVFIKNKNDLNNEPNHNSLKNLFSINILNRVREEKQNKNKNDFYHIVKVKKPVKSNNKNDSNSNNKNNDLYNNKNIKSPLMRKKKTTYFKKGRLNNDNGNKTKEEMDQNYMSSFSIKVNKSNNNKDKRKIGKYNNLKKTLTKNKMPMDHKFNNNIK